MLAKYILILCFLVGTAYAVYSALQKNPHEFTEAQCADCHAARPVKNDRSTLAMTAPIGTLCRRCHAQSKDDSLSHPVDMRPAHIAIPADLPLSREGEMTCVTCHDIHASPPPDHEGSWHFLRRDVSGRAFCASCHPGGEVAAGQSSGHAREFARAHMKYEERTGGLIDSVSMGCLSCHDGTIGKRSDVQVGIFRHGFSSSGLDPQGSHPIGVKYRRAMRERGGLHPVGQLNHKIRLVSGMVSCVSCHDPYSKEPKQLVMDNRGAKLCLSCHDK
jgi:predicted CXXCH cytochrome family protein